MSTTRQPEPEPLPPTAGEAPRSRSTWLILIAAAAFVAIAQFSIGGSSDTRECKREAHENAGIAKALGGEERYVEMCMELQKKVREVGQRK